MPNVLSLINFDWNYRSWFFGSKNQDLWWPLHFWKKSQTLHWVFWSPVQNVPKLPRAPTPLYFQLHRSPIFSSLGRTDQVCRRSSIFLIFLSIYVVLFKIVFSVIQEFFLFQWELDVQEMLTNIFRQLRDPALSIYVEEVVVIHHLILFRFFTIAALCSWLLYVKLLYLVHS